MRWIVRFAVFLLVLSGLAVAALMLVPGERIARIAERRFEAATGRTITLSGDIGATIYPQLGIRIGQVEVANADWSSAGPMLTADGARIGVDLMSLVSGAVRINEVEVTRPVLRLEAAADGRTNWDFEVTEEAGADVGADTASGTLPAFVLDRGIIEGAEVSYVNHATGQDTTLSDLDMELRLPAFDGPANIELSALLRGQLQQVSAEIDVFDVFLAGDVTGLHLTAKTGNNSLTLDGRGGYAPTAFDGRLEAEFGDLAALFTTIAQDPVDLPQGLGRDQIGIAGQVTLTPDQTLHMRDGDIRLDQNQISAGFDIDLKGARPEVNARLSGGALDFSSLAAGSDGSGDGSGGGTSGGGWSTDPIDASFLSVVDGQIALTAESVDLGTMTLGATDVLTTIDRARAVFALRDISAYDGQVTGQFVMNNRSGLSVGGNMRIADVAMQPLLRDLAGYERLIGTGNLQLEFLGVGNTLDAIMKSLSGNGSLALGQGELRGLDLAGMLRNLDAAYEGSGAKTIFDAINASFVINGGVLRNDDLRFSAPLASATGAGSVDIGRQRFDYRVIPTAMAGEDGSGGISVPVLITGPWSNPSFRPDLEYILQQELDDERREIEERLRQQAEEELGLVREEGESVEDAVKRRLEEELGDQLRGLLGGD